MRTFAVANHKGGVGKTTTTLFLGAALAEAGQQVLLVDNDPQASLTRVLGVEAEAGRTTASCFEALDAGEASPPVSQLAVPVQAWGLDVVPADLSLAKREGVRTPGDEQALRLVLEDVPYDVAIIDAPGSLGLLTQAALVAATGGVLVPTTADHVALSALGDLTRLVGVVGRHYQPGCRVAGIVVTMHDRTAEAGRHLAALREEWGSRLLEPPVPHRVAVREALAAGVPLAELGSRSGAPEVAAAYAALADALAVGAVA